MNFIIELAWGFSTVIGIKIIKNSVISIFSNQTIFIKHISKLNFTGILLFLVEIALLCWVKFYEVSHVVAWVATGMLIPIMIVFVAFAALFYLKLVAHKSEVNMIFISSNEVDQE